MDTKEIKNESKGTDEVIKEEKIFIELDEQENEAVKHAVRRVFDKMFGEYDENLPV